ncbi:hypothetical protein LDENG_00018280 [Lucifuga dentata]|nr:hypothetical protein LDENG_00018280 [Lucifuga dentata]
MSLQKSMSGRCSPLGLHAVHVVPPLPCTDMSSCTVNLEKINKPEVINDLPPEACSDKLELWLSYDKAEAHESTLGLSRHCDTDTIGFKHKPTTYGKPRMKNIYRTLASQYDPLGFTFPFTTRAKIIIQQLWDKHRDWDDPQLPDSLLQTGQKW